MTEDQKAPTTIDDYIAGFSEELRVLLKRVRATIKEVAPEAEERISYGIPTFRLNGRSFIHFAAFKRHISVYPAPRGVEAFDEELSAYKGGKGTVQFPLERAIPYGLIERIARYRLEEHRAQAAEKGTARQTLALAVGLRVAQHEIAGKEEVGR